MMSEHKVMGRAAEVRDGSSASRVGEEALMANPKSSFARFAVMFKEMTLLREEYCQRVEVGKANKVFMESSRSVAKYEQDTPEFRQVMTELIADKQGCIALHAAAMGLFHVPNTAEARLEELRQGEPSETRFSADLVLKEWRAGRLKPWWRERWPKKDAPRTGD